MFALNRNPPTMAYSRSPEYHETEQLISAHSKITCHPARLRILYQLSKSSLTLAQIQEDHPLPRTTVMGHLSMLLAHHLVELESSDSPATYTTSKNQWPPFIAHAVRLAHRFKYANAA